MTDEQLVALCKRGDKVAWEQLYERYKPRVLKIARRFFLSGGETEDLVQEGMCGLYSAVNGFVQDKANFSAFASSCIRNRIVDAVKKSGRLVSFGCGLDAITADEVRVVGRRLFRQACPKAVPSHAQALRDCTTLKLSCPRPMKQ